MHNIVVCFWLLALMVPPTFSLLADTTAVKASVPIFQEPVTTKHSVTIDGQKIGYDATAGHLTLVSEDGTVKAKVFFVSYVRTGDKGATAGGSAAMRPITFSFNGGPGSSSVWLHLGVLGPRRVLMNDDGTAKPPPNQLVDNEMSWLDLTDMVFIDPVSTGYSRTPVEKDAKEYHGYQQDIESVGEFIRRWITDNKRWASAKYLIGESYGTTRASGLSEYLQQRYGMYLNGVILVSAVLNFQTIDFAEGNDLPYVMFLPTYAATAWYHKKLSKEMLAKPVDDVVQEARQYASTEYTLALMKGASLSKQERTDVVNKLRMYTGLSEVYINKAELRPVIYRFCQELLRDSGEVVGRFDSRYKGAVADKLSESMERDPSHHPTIGGSFATCINDYLTRELNVSTTLPYEVLTGRVHPWDFSVAQNEYLNVAPKLREAILMNPNLRIWVANGYYDLATPVYATEYTFDHMFLPERHRKNIRMTYYHAGHMMYLLNSELIKMKGDAKSFYSK
ncbi:MAG: peptidase S10 [Ignavibacteria bacterium]|nr:peptidase S10 [Ignavibacteria bacterium]